MNTPWRPLAGLFLLIALDLTVSTVAADEARSGIAVRRPRNVILMIGDGMGFTHLTSARYLKGRLAVEDMKSVGVSYTASLLNFVTDSSAGATALASGFLIRNGEVGIQADGTPVKLLVEYAEEKGLWTGLVVTSRITHATPASMLTHVAGRGSEDEIAEQIAASEVDVILGGGWDKFLPLRSQKVNDVPSADILDATASLPPGRSVLASGRLPGRGAVSIALEKPLLSGGKPYGTRKDGRDLVAEMKGRGYRFIRSAGELAIAVEGAPSKLLGLFHSGPMPRATEGRSPSLAAMSLAALKILSPSPEGFFLMIEGSQIDWGGHANDFEYVMHEAADFDSAIGAVMRFLKDAGIDGETLLVVTADHETGGLTLNVDSQLALGFEPKWTTTYHTAAPVPIFSCGPGAELFSGVTNHERVGRRLIECVVGHEVKFEYRTERGKPEAMSPWRKF